MCNEKTEVNAKSKPVASQVNFLMVIYVYYSCSCYCTPSLYIKKMKETKKQKEESKHGRYIEIIILLHKY